MKPTLEQVKEHFKDAKIVKDSHGISVKMKQKVFDNIYFSDYGNYTYKSNNCHYLYFWSEKDGYAEITEYKDINKIPVIMEEVKPKHYELIVTDRKTGNKLTCDYIDVANAMGLSIEQFMALRYMRKKGGIDKQINDTEKGIESLKAYKQKLTLNK